MAIENRDIALESILRSEGFFTANRGWMNDPADSGGATISGITWRNYAEYCGVDPSTLDPNDPALHEQMKAMPEEHIRLYYVQHKLAPIKFNELPPGVDIAVADAATLHGPRQAAKFLQRALGVTDDGRIGPATVAAAQEHPDWDGLIQNMSQQRLDFYERLIERRPKDAKWRRGWYNRTRRVEAEAMALAPDQSQRMAGEPAAPATDLGKPMAANEAEEQADNDFWSWF